MFSSFMTNTWLAATIVAVVAGMVGFFVVLRGSSFVAHAVPKSAFAGAAGAALVGANTLAGLGVFALLGALTIGWLGRRGRNDVVTALSIVLMLGIGALFLSWSSEYASEAYALLFGQVLGVSGNDVAVTAALALVTVAALVAIYRPLLLSSVLPELAEVRGVRPGRIELAFLVLVALVTTTAVPVVGTLLMFSLMVGPPAAARALSRRPSTAVALSIAIALATVWASIAASYETNWPIGFYVGTFSALAYILARSGAAVAGRASELRAAATDRPAGQAGAARTTTELTILS
jgi:zinc/manganese transport system permease protein